MCVGEGGGGLTTGACSCSHTEWGCKTFPPFKMGRAKGFTIMRGAEKIDRRFSTFVAPPPVSNDQTLKPL